MVTSIKKREIIFGLVVLIIFVTVLSKYYLSSIKGYLENRFTPEKILVSFKDCVNMQERVLVKGGYVCKDSDTPIVWEKIYYTYPISALGKEVPYSFIDDTNISVADQLIDNKWELPRYNEVNINTEDPSMWEENPYDERYWRFIYYSLRETRYLLNAWRETGDVKYKDKLVEILNSYFANEDTGKYIWEDYHAVSYRALTLVNTWWKLREYNYLTPELSDKLLDSINKHGKFLLDKNHFQPDNNHGITEAMALLTIGVNFPDLPESFQFANVAKERLDESLKYLVDEDGVLTENSPYYQFYILEKYWDIYKYSKKYGIDISADYKRRLDQMINYATYILQPDLHVPLLGASLDRKIRLNGIYKEISNEYPEFKYVLTQGKEGKKPSELNITYPKSGQVIMRSGWGNSKNYVNTTQLIFDIGKYRTKHSDLDSLSFSLFGEGRSIMPDSGLYTYEDGLFRNYFHGTLAHNTVVVDNKDQEEGATTKGQFTEQNGVVTQTAEHSLYEGVNHRRAISLLGDKIVLVVDDLSSQKTHTYDQIFHLAPDLSIEKQDNVVYAKDSTGKVVASVREIYTTDYELNTYYNDPDTPKGICSFEYERYVPCYMLDFRKQGTNVRYITLIQLGEPDPQLSWDLAPDKTIRINTRANTYDVKITTTESKSMGVVVTNNSIPDTEHDITHIVGNFDVKTSNDKTTVSKVFPTTLSLEDKNLLLDLKIINRNALHDLKLILTDRYNNSATINLLNSYRLEYEGETIAVSIGKGEKRSTHGGWTLTNKSFDWSGIVFISVKASSQIAESSDIQFNYIKATSAQLEPKIIIVFDDGLSSIEPAVDYMYEKDMKGNIAVIGERVVDRTNGYLTLEYLKKYQDIYGWNILSHSYSHRNALENYYNSDKLSGFEIDLLQNIQFLKQNQLDSAQNWYIYPNGATNATIKSIVSKYYKFARTTINTPESYPFGDPMGVKTISADGAVEKEYGSIPTPLEELIYAIDDAKKYNQTLFITFHRIHATSTDRAGYPLEDFKKLIDHLEAENLKTYTLSDFDKSNNISKMDVSYTPAVPSQLELYVSPTRNTFLKKMLNLFQ